MERLLCSPERCSWVLCCCLACSLSALRGVVGRWALRMALHCEGHVHGQGWISVASVAAVSSISIIPDRSTDSGMLK